MFTKLIKLCVLTFTLCLPTISLANYDKEIHFLAMAIHNEARGESLAGKKAVANVIINRTKHKEFPKTIRGVITQKGQFQWYRNKKLRARTSIPKETIDLAKKLYKQSKMKRRKDNTNGAIFFSSNGVKPAPRAIKSVKVGRHQFYRLRNSKGA